MSFATKLRELRKAAGMTQAELADAIHLQKSAISMYENGKRQPEYEILEAIADTFNVNMDTLLDRKTLAVRNVEIFTGTPVMQPQKEDFEQIKRDAIARAFMEMIFAGKPEILAIIKRATITTSGEIKLPDADKVSEAVINAQLQNFINALNAAKLNDDGTATITFKP